MPNHGFFRINRKPEAQPLTFDDVLAANYKPVPAVPQKTNVVEAFNALALNDRSPQQGRFVGGFHVANPRSSGHPSLHHASSAPTAVPGALPRPPAMPMPRSQPHVTRAEQRTSPGMSRTMQHALQPQHQPQHHNRVLKPTPSITPDTSLYKTAQSHSLRPPSPEDNRRRRSDVTINVIPTPAGSSSPATPKRPARARASSSPPSTVTSPNSTSVQCHGVTKAGNRCKKMIKVASSSPDDQDKHFCHQHSKEVLSPSGTYSRKSGEWIVFADWVPSYLHPDTQIALREEMDKARSSSDKPGYIYTFEIRDPDSPSTVKLKVGRAVNLVKRIDEWNKQCGSKEQVLRGFYPGVVEDEEGDEQETFSLMKGRVRPGQKTSCCHRLERLIHLELGDLVASQIYLDSGWPTKVVASANDTNKGLRKALKREKCPDCEQVHKEIFEFTRIRSGRYKNQEFDKIVKPVIEKWGAFVEAYI